jgi:hypothetical protein
MGNNLSPAARTRTCPPGVIDPSVSLGRLAAACHQVGDGVPAAAMASGTLRMSTSDMIAKR